MFSRSLPSVITMLVLIGLAALSACSSSESTTSATTITTTAANRAQIAARTTRWHEYNRGRTKFHPADTAIARDLAERLRASAITCSDFGVLAFDITTAPYIAQGLPIPSSGSSCTGPSDEDVLFEVYRAAKRPNAADLVAAKRKLLCQRGRDLGRLPDGSSDFPGIPYVISADKVWIVEPDTFETNQRIATALGLESRDMCAGIT